MTSFPDDLDLSPVEWVGAVQDVRPYLERAHVFVLPSYREGTPRSTLEALSMGMPVVTTDAVGCRETVRDGANGFVVPVADGRALGEAMEGMISAGAERLAEMGRRSRELAVETFDVRKVNEVLMRFLAMR